MSKLTVILNLIKVLGPKLKDLWPVIMQIIAALTDKTEGQLARAPKDGGFAGTEEHEEAVQCCIDAGISEKKARAVFAHVSGEEEVEDEELEDDDLEDEDVAEDEDEE